MDWCCRPSEVNIFVKLYILKVLEIALKYDQTVFSSFLLYLSMIYSKTRILQTRIIRIHAYSEVISIPGQNPFKMIRKNEGLKQTLL